MSGRVLSPRLEAEGVSKLDLEKKFLLSGQADYLWLGYAKQGVLKPNIVRASM